MITESTKLVTTFLNSDRKKHNWTYQDVDTSLSAEEIKEACELLTTLNLFEQDGVTLFDSVVTAKVRVYEERLVFDPEHEPLSENEQTTETDCQALRCFNVSNQQDFLAIAPSHRPVLSQEGSADQPAAAAIRESPPARPTEAVTKSGWLQRLFRRRSRNKEDPNDN